LKKETSPADKSDNSKLLPVMIFDVAPQAMELQLRLHLMAALLSSAKIEPAGICLEWRISAISMLEFASSLIA
jgi:hypothetical protein